MQKVLLLTLPDGGVRMLKDIVTLIISAAWSLGATSALAYPHPHPHPNPNPYPPPPPAGLQLWDNIGTNYIGIYRYNTYSFQLVGQDPYNRPLTYGCYHNCVGVHVNAHTGWVSIYAGSSVPITYTMQFGVTNGYQTLYKNYTVRFQ